LIGPGGISMDKRARRAIAHGALTNSKRPESLIRGFYPAHIVRAHGCTVVDADGNRYLDTICGLGTNLVGYGNAVVNRAVQGALQTGGSVFSLGSAEEVEYAETIKETLPHLERVRFLKTGSEGCAAAVRIARAFTGRRNVYSEGYHGWADEFVSLTPPADGIPHHKHIMKLESPFDPFAAAVIIEPVITDLSAERVAWLQNLKAFCTRHKVVLIFDETITAFRFPGYCVARHLNILPDLWIGGKAIAGGLPLSVIGGRKEVMEADYFVSSTWAGDRMALAAAKATNRLVHDTHRPEELWAYGTEFRSKFNELSPHVQADGYATRGVWKFASPVWKHLFFQEMCNAGILVGPSWFWSKDLQNNLKNILSVSRDVIRKINDGKARPQGEAPQSPFAERVRNAD
jgi:glutamate-1-semialdehyde 2,1-aminomutase